MVKTFLLIIIGMVIKLLLFLISIVVLLYIFYYVTEWTNPEFHGSHDLGDGIYLIDMDQGSIIVHGIKIEGNTCYSGSDIIPSYKCQYDSTGKRNEYVLKADTIDKWVIAMSHTNNPNGTKYYILDKQKLKEIDYNIDDSFAYLNCYYDKLSFLRACRDLKIEKSIEW